MERYNHKYKHCIGVNCEKREDCIHHLAYQEALALRLKNIETVEHCDDEAMGYVRVTIEKVE